MLDKYGVHLDPDTGEILDRNLNYMAPEDVTDLVNELLSLVGALYHCLSTPFCDSGLAGQTLEDTRKFIDGYGVTPDNLSPWRSR